MIFITKKGDTDTDTYNGTDTDTYNNDTYNKKIRARRG